MTSRNVDIVDVEDKRLGTLVAVKGYKDADKAIKDIKGKGGGKVNENLSINVSLGTTKSKSESNSTTTVANASGNINIDLDKDLTNHYSKIKAGKNLTVNGSGTVENVGYQGTVHYYDRGNDCHYWKYKKHRKMHIRCCWVYGTTVISYYDHTILLNNIQNKNGCRTTSLMQHDSHCVLKFGRYFFICSIQQVCSLLFLS